MDRKKEEARTHFRRRGRTTREERIVTSLQRLVTTVAREAKTEKEK